jgi:hypothetical protein
MRRPIGITLLAFLYTLDGVGSGLSTWYLYTHSDALLNVVRLYYGAEFQSFQFGYYSILTVLSVISVLFIVMGIGLFGLESWSWALGVMLQGGSVVLAVVVMVRGLPASAPTNVGPAAALSCVINLLILIYLLSPGVREAFAG